MEYIKFDNNAKQLVVGDEELIKKADFNFEGATLEEVKIEGKYITLKIKNKVNTVTFELDHGAVMNFKATSGKKYIIRNVEYADTEKNLFLTFTLDKYSDFRFSCADIEIKDVE